MGQVITQLIAAGISVGYAFLVSLVLVKVVDVLVGFTTDAESETIGLDRTEHGEVGFDLGPTLELAPAGVPAEPRPAMVPPNGGRRFTAVVEGVDGAELAPAWSALCQPGETPGC